MGSLGIGLTVAMFRYKKETIDLSSVLERLRLNAVHFLYEAIVGKLAITLRK
jgi:hypothetical protein